MTPAKPPYESQLFEAATAGDRETLALVIRQAPDGPDTDDRVRLAMRYAIAHKRPDLARELIELAYGNRVPEQLARFALSRCASAGDDASLEILLRFGANPNAMDEMKSLPLCYASESSGKPGPGQLRCLELLLAAGANPNRPDGYGDLPLVLAADSLWLAAVERLLAAGADPNAMSSQGATPLSTLCHRAASADFEAIAMTLAKAGADPSQPLRQREFESFAPTPLSILNARLPQMSLAFGPRLVSAFELFLLEKESSASISRSPPRL